ncbi:MAG: hypothetical protein HY885_18065 [Deltaproteobacteria bacterium]|nr:hypothetical protein [Deltaproteobacteria bacterium]
MSLPRKQKKETVDLTFWHKRHGVIYSRKGGWVVGEAVYNHGYSMMDELVGKASFFQVLILNVTGRMVERRLADWLENIFICLSWPDARIWCNQVGSLGGTMRTSPVAAVCSGVLAADSPMYGSAPLLAASQFIVDALLKKNKGMPVAEIVKLQQRRPGMPPNIVGYARPVASGDERVPAMKRVSSELGYTSGEHLTLAFEIEGFLLEKFNESMNIGGYIAGFLSDQEFNPQEIYRMCSMVVNSGVHACYVESMENPPESFFPLRCDDIDYQGVPSRPVPARG